MKELHSSPSLGDDGSVDRERFCCSGAWEYANSTCFVTLDASEAEISDTTAEELVPARMAMAADGRRRRMILFPLWGRRLRQSRIKMKCCDDGETTCEMPRPIISSMQQMQSRLSNNTIINAGGRSRTRGNSSWGGAVLCKL